MWRDDAYVLDMLLAAREVVELTQGVTAEEFLAKRILQHAMMRLVQIIGEAARQVSEEYRQAHSEVPWRDIVGMRHRLVHEYFRIIPERVWEVVVTDVPALIPLLEPLVPPDDPSDD